MPLFQLENEFFKSKKELFKSKKELFKSKKELLDAKMGFNFEFLGCGITPLPLKNFMHPFFQVLGDAPVQKEHH